MVKYTLNHLEKADRIHRPQPLWLMVLCCRSFLSALSPLFSNSSSLLPLLVLYGVSPIVDLIIGERKQSWSDSRSDDSQYRSLTIATVPLLFVLIAIAWAAGTKTLSAIRKFALALLRARIAVLVGTAHELGHKIPRWKIRWLKYS